MIEQTESEPIGIVANDAGQSNDEVHLLGVVGDDLEPLVSARRCMAPGGAARGSTAQMLLHVLHETVVIDEPSRRDDDLTRDVGGVEEGPDVVRHQSGDRRR